MTEYPVYPPCTQPGGFHYYPTSEAAMQSNGSAFRCAYCDRLRPTGLDIERAGQVAAFEPVEPEFREVDALVAGGSRTARIPSERETLAREFLPFVSESAIQDPGRRVPIVADDKAAFAKWVIERAFALADEFIAQRDAK